MTRMKVCKFIFPFWHLSVIDILVSLQICVGAEGVTELANGQQKLAEVRFPAIQPN